MTRYIHVIYIYDVGFIYKHFVMADSETNTLSQLTTDDINIYSSGNFTQ